MYLGFSVKCNCITLGLKVKSSFIRLNKMFSSGCDCQACSQCLRYACPYLSWLSRTLPQSVVGNWCFQDMIFSHPKGLKQNRCKYPGHTNFPPLTTEGAQANSSDPGVNSWAIKCCESSCDCGWSMSQGQTLTISMSYAVSFLEIRKAKKSLRLMLKEQPSSRVKVSDSSDVA